MAGKSIIMCSTGWPKLLGIMGKGGCVTSLTILFIHSFPLPTGSFLKSYLSGPLLPSPRLKNLLWIYHPSGDPGKCVMEIVTHCSLPVDPRVPKPQSPRVTLKVLKLGFDPFQPGPHVNKKWCCSHSIQLCHSLPEAGNQTHFPIWNSGLFLFFSQAAFSVLATARLHSLIHSAYTC